MQVGFKRGFLIIEAAIAIMIIGIAMSSLYTVIYTVKKVLHNEKIAIEKEKTIKKLISYVHYNNLLPQPIYSNENNHLIFGILPDEYCLSSKFYYIVPDNLVYDKPSSYGPLGHAKINNNNAESFSFFNSVSVYPIDILPSGIAFIISYIKLDDINDLILNKDKWGKSIFFIFLEDIKNTYVQSLIWDINLKKQNIQTKIYGDTNNAEAEDDDDDFL